MSWQLLGFGLTVGWMWLFLLNGPVLAGITQSWPSGGENCFQLFLISSALSFLLIGKRYKSLLLHKCLLILASLLMALTPALFILIIRRAESIPSFSWLIYMLAITGGFGLTVLMLAWLETFTFLTFKNTCLLYSGGVFIASLLLFTGELFSLSFGLWASILIPLSAIYALFKYLKSRHYLPDTDPAPAINSNRKAYPAKLIWLIILFYTAGGLMYKLASLKYIFANLFWTSNISYLAVVILAGGVFFLVPSLDLRLLYRPVLPLLAAGFILFPLLTGKAGISFIMLQAGFALFDMYTWLLIVNTARQSQRSLPTLGLGMFWILIAISGGNLTFSAIAPLIPIQKQPDSVVIIAGLITLLASLFFQDNKVTSTDWGTAKTRLDQELPKTVEPESELSLEKYNLTPREKEILVLLLKGRNNPFISENLNISPNTLKFHLRNIYQKFAVTNRQKLLDLFEKENC